MSEHRRFLLSIERVFENDLFLLCHVCSVTKHDKNYLNKDTVTQFRRSYPYSKKLEFPSFLLS